MVVERGAEALIWSGRESWWPMLWGDPAWSDCDEGEERERDDCGCETGADEPLMPAARRR